MTLQVPVLIVGAGPVGLFAGLLLDQHGIDYRIIEQRPTLHQAPQAHVISSRTLEICRSVGIDHMMIRRLGPDLADISSIRWVDRLAGRDLGIFDLAPRRQAEAAIVSHPSPTPSANLSQDLFETVLFDHLSNPSRVLFSHAWSSIDKTANGYLSTVDTGDGVVEIESSYVIGADGAGSRVRKALGIDMVGPDNIQSFMNIHFRSNLRSQLAGREGLLYWVMDDEVAGTFVAHDIESNWIYMKTIDADEPVDPVDQDKFAQLLLKAIGVDVELEILSMSPWRMTAQVAERYQDGRVFLVGDAAHRFPPTGGIGMNTGIQDAHNLVWKIAMVERGFDDTLLATYEIERKPVAETNSAQSLSNAVKMFEVAALLDVDGDQRITMTDLDAVVADAGRSENVQAAINRQAAHFNMSGLDLGFCYVDSSAVIDDGPPPTPDDPVSHYVPSTTPGARLPHAELERRGQPISTLDLVSHDSFVVLADSNVDLRHLDDLELPVAVIQIGEDQEIGSVGTQFTNLFDANQLLIVRPDGHIAARLAATASRTEVERNLAALLTSRKNTT